MKHMVKKGLAALALVLSANTHAYIVDTYIAGTKAGNSGDATTLNWVKSVTGNSNLVQTGSVSGSGAWSYDSILKQFYTAIDSTTDYFIVKTGNLKLASGWDTFLFQNIGELSLAVVERSQFCGNSSSCEFNIGKFSHLRTYDGSTAEVPEPGSLALLAAGIAGLIATRRYTAKA